MSEAPEIRMPQSSPHSSGDPDGEAEEHASDLPPPQPPDSLRAAPRRRSTPRRAGWLAVLLLVVVVAGVAASPFWAPRVMPLLPWTGDEPALAARLAALDQQNAAARAELAGLRSAQEASARRLARNAAAIAGLEAKLAALGRRLDTMAARPTGDHPATLPKLQQDVTGLAAKVASLGQRLGAVAARPAIDPAALPKLQQEVAGLDKRAGDLANRVAAIETRMAAQPRSTGKETALLLALLQMRDRIDDARPFAAQYDAFAALAQDRPELRAAAAPLAALARSGVASRAALARDLSRRAGAIATAPPAAAAGSGAGEEWSAGVLDQLRRLVTIRRRDGSRQTPAEAAVAHAEGDLARGDLAGAVAALQTLSGPPAAAARPWLAAARRRLTAEAALSRLQQMLAARALQQAAPASPATAPASAPQPAAGPPSRDENPGRDQP